MKKSILLGSVASLLLGTTSYAQVSNPTNNGAAGLQYIGYNGLFPANTKPLDMNNGYTNQPIRFFTNSSGTNGNAFSTERMRINANGFIGLNNTTPNFHLDINTPEIFGGELLFRARVAGDITASMNIINLAGQNSTIFVPALFGLQSSATTGSAFTTIGSIDNSQDLANLTPISRFFSARDYNPEVLNFSMDRVNVLHNRPLFQWLNAIDGLMLMDARGFLGIATAIPGNRLEINSDFYNANGTPGQGTNAEVFFNTANTAGGTGFSGLRFTDLRSTSAPRTSNPGQGVLSVDENGDVIYVPSGATVNGFVSCNNPDPSSGQLINDSKINLNDNNFFFTDNINPYDIDKNKVAIGYDCSASSLRAKLNVKLDHYSSPAYPRSIVGYFENNDYNSSNSSSSHIGINSNVSRLQDVNLLTNHYGIMIFSRNATNNYGVHSYSYATALNLGKSATGGYFGAGGGSIYNYGIHTIVSGPANSIVRAGYFSGLVEATNITIPSDSQFKDNISEEKDALVKISKLKPVTYKMKTNEFPQFSFTSEVQHGFIVQELENYFPELVHNSYHPGELDSLGNEIVAPVTYKSLNYNGLISINTQAINELNQKVDRQTLSDENLKINVEEISNSLNKVLEMRGVSYSWDLVNHPELNLDSTEHIGFIAQEINQIDSRLTFTDNNDFMHVDYDKIVPILAESIQELNNTILSKDSTINAQQSQINNLNDRLTQLESCLSALLPTLCSMNQEAIQQNNEEIQNSLEKSIIRESNNPKSANPELRLSDKNVLILSQNVPNPFAEMTTIKYNIPISIKEAQIHFYTSSGLIINSVQISQRGNGELKVFAEDLSSGLYTYSLVADGKVVATKKMVKE